jgi:hypothetical protein
MLVGIRAIVAAQCPGKCRNHRVVQVRCGFDHFLVMYGLVDPTQAKQCSGSVSPVVVGGSRVSRSLLDRCEHVLAPAGKRIGAQRSWIRCHKLWSKKPIEHSTVATALWSLWWQYSTKVQYVISIVQSKMALNVTWTVYKALVVLGANVMTLIQTISISLSVCLSMSDCVSVCLRLRACV